MRLSGKVAIITGAAAGLGRAIAARFAREGALVVAADTNAADGNFLVDRLTAEGCDAIFVRTDVADENAVRNLVESALARYRRIDILCNNAGILLADRDVPIHELSAETWDFIMSVNLRGAFLCAKYTIPAMLAQGGGSIIQMGSPTGMIGCAPRLTAYSTSKAGIMGMTRVMAAAYAQNNIRVNSIAPGTMETPMNRHLLTDPAIREQTRSTVPLGRIGKPEDIEGLAVFLASDESSFCTGGLYLCDGGLTAM